VGKRISREGLTERAGYGDAVMEDLAEELNIDRSTLVRAVAFFKMYKSAPGGTNLTWSHYKELLSIRDDRKRRFYENEADQERSPKIKSKNAPKSKTAVGFIVLYEK